MSILLVVLFVGYGWSMNLVSCFVLSDGFEVGEVVVVGENFGM